MISGFSNGISSATKKNYALNLRNPNADWREMDDLPVAEGITHGAFAQDGTKVYMCGGYVGTSFRSIAKANMLSFFGCRYKGGHPVRCLVENVHFNLINIY